MAKVTVYNLARCDMANCAAIVVLSSPGRIEGGDMRAILDAPARSVPDDVQAAIKKTTALALMEHNESLGRRLRAQGIDRVSAPADQLAFGMLQRFLDLKARRRA